MIPPNDGPSSPRMITGPRPCGWLVKRIVLLFSVPVVRTAAGTALKRNASCLRGLLLGSVALLVAVSCQNDRKNLVGPAPQGKAHIPVSFSSATTTASGATFTTDKDDYAPGDTLKLAGGGWQAGDSLDILLDETPQNHPPVSWAVGVDSSGRFRDSSYVVQESDLGVTFALTATSRKTGETATATFTDGQPTVNTVTLSPANPNPSQSPFTATFTVSINGQFQNPWKATGWRIYPKGNATGAYTCVDSPNLTTAGTSQLFALSLTTPSSEGQYTLDIQTYSDDGTNCQSKVGGGSTTNFNVGTPAPDLTITKSHAGMFTGGTTGSYKIQVKNSGSLVTSGGNTDDIIVTDVLPTGLTWLSATGTQWTCNNSVQTITCTRSHTHTLAVGDTTPSITLTVNVAASGSTAITNTATVSGGGEPAARNGNNSASDGTTIVYPDAQAPVINCTAPNQSIWYGNDVIVQCTASDAGSGLASSGDAGFSLSTSVLNGTETASALTGSHQICDNNGNCATAGPYAFKVDKKAPVVSCGAADGAWHASDASIACTATDGGSGLANAGDATFNLSTNVASGTETSNASTGTHDVADAVGNTTTAGPIGGNKVDKKGPEVGCGTADGLWHAADVSVACTASDGGSGLASSADASFSLSTSEPSGTETGNASTGTHNVADAVGNTTTAGPINGNKVDKKAPVVSCGLADGLWHAADVSIACTASDGGSGLANSADASFSLSTSEPSGTETSNASTGTHNVADAVGNSATAGPISGNKVDKKDPVVSCGSADGLWHGADVSIGCTATDGGSGLANAGDATFNLSTNVASGTETNDASTGSRTVADAVGNSATAGPISGNKVDKKDPVVSCGLADGLWHGADVSIACTATDGGSGLANPADASFNLTTNVLSGTETSNASTGTHDVADAVGNSATAGPISGNKVDKKGPVVNLVCPALPVILGSPASANWTASDGGSGVDADYQSGSIPLATGSVGSKTGTAPAGTSVDNVNNKSPVVNCSYSVIYDWTGFFQPVDNPTALNVAKAGSSIPVKFNLGGNQGLSIFIPNSPISSLLTCSAYAVQDNIEETVTAGQSSLTYDETAHQYIYVWKSDKSWAGTCRRLDVKLIDGTTHSALFKWTK